MVAMRGRKGQIRLAIDKNIPKDVDLDALEMAELPSGGARVVARSFAEVNRQNEAVAASARAAALALGKQTGKSAPIPVLMDPVQLRASPGSHAAAPAGKPATPTSARVVATKDAGIVATEKATGNATGSATGRARDAAIAVATTPAQPGERETLASYASGSRGKNSETMEDNAGMESADSVLLDYGQRRTEDNLAQVTPDYPDDDYEDDLDEDFDEDEFDDDEFADEEFDEESDDFDDDDDEFDDDYDRDEDEEDEDDEEFEDDDEDDDFLDDDDEYDPLDDEDNDYDDADLDDDLNFIDDENDDFSMTAGERIGFTTPAPKTQRQPSLFGDDADEHKPVPKAKRKPLFAAFGRKAKAPVAQTTPKPIPVPTVQQAAKPSPKPVAAAQPEVALRKPVQEPAVSQSRPVAPAVQRERLKADMPARGNSAREMRRETAGNIERTPASTQERVTAEPSEVVVINVMSKAGRLLAGDELLHVLITTGMKFGDMNIFHRRLGGDNKGPVIFSIANILNPGTFDLNRMHEFTTRGVSLFLALPTVINNLEAFEQMLTAARQIADALDGELRDDHRNLMTAQTIEHYRQRIRDFELRRLKAVGARA